MKRAIAATIKGTKIKSHFGKPLSNIKKILQNVPTTKIVVPSAFINLLKLENASNMADIKANIPNRTKTSVSVINFNISLWSALCQA